MILKEMTIQNFKGIKEPLKIKFKPIMLLFGQNSSGKSSIIQAINYAREIFISGGDVNPDRRIANNRIENLGNYHNITYNHDLTQRIIFEFLLDYDENKFSDFIHSTINTELSSLDYIKNQNTDDFEKLIYSEIKYISNKIKRISLKFAIVWNEKKCEPIINKILVMLNDSPLYIIIVSISEDLYILDTISFYKHPILPESIERALQEEDCDTWNGMYHPDQEYLETLTNEKDKDEYLEEYGKGFEEQWGSYVQEQCEIRKNKTQDEILFTLTTKHRTNIPLFDALKQDCGWQEYAHKENREFNQNLISALVTTPITTLIEVFSCFEHIGPLREIPHRDYRPIKYPESFCWTTGMAAYDVLMHPSTTEDFINELNKWLVNKDYLNTGYYIELKKYSLVDEQSLLWKFIDGAEDIGDIDKIRDAIKTALMQDRKTEFKIKDKNSNIELLLQDVGTGISQILPIVIGALWLENKAITIEQPELHIHPAMQSEMGDLLIKSAKHNGESNNFFIVETHSEHLMLRILRRIRETTDDENDKKLYLSPDDVAVYYIKSGENGVKATHISINDDGRFDSPWPDGFFAERSKELF